MNKVFVLSNRGKQLMPCSPARARMLLNSKKAKIKKIYPFVIQLIHRSGEFIQPVELKFDPGSKKTGIGLVSYNKNYFRAVFAGTLIHRGQDIKNNLDSRRNIRKARRSRKTRYRKPRFLNRVKRKYKGWIAPSLKSRVDNILEWTKRFLLYAPIKKISLELVKFNPQVMEDSFISGIKYKKDSLLNYEVKEYLLEKYEYKCVYCGAKEVKLEKEHVVPISIGGSNRINNLVISCRPCNEKKDNLSIDVFLKDKPALLKKIKDSLRQSLKDVAAVNITRNFLIEKIKSFGIDTLTGSGAETKYNRDNQGYKKEHYIDALCVGETGKDIFIPKRLTPLVIKKERRNDRQMTKVDKYGFPRAKAKSQRQVAGFKTGDLVKVIVLKGKKKGKYIGRVAIRKSGIFDVKTKNGIVQGIHNKCFTILQKTDGYSYSK